MRKNEYCGEIMIDLDIFLIDYEISNINSNWWLEILNIFLKAGEKFIVMDFNNDNSFLEKVLDYSKNAEIKIQNNFVEVSGVLTEKMIKDFNEDYKLSFAEDKSILQI